MVQRSGILNISTLKGSYRIGGVMVVKPAVIVTTSYQKLVLCDVMVVR
jgi:hypothetical protein